MLQKPWRAANLQREDAKMGCEEHSNPDSEEPGARHGHSPVGSSSRGEEEKR